MLKITAQQNALVTEYIYNKCGINLSEKAYMVESKVGLECFLQHIPSFEEYWKQLSASGDAGEVLRQRLVDALTTNYSYFYREEDHFQILSALLAEGKIEGNDAGIRGWCAGCANGQEAYTLAMALEDASLAGLLKKPYSLQASDISQKAIKTAMAGQYSMSEYVRVPQNWRKAYMHVLPNGCEVRKSLRSKVNFKQENILKKEQEIVNGSYDFIFCRNVLIYFDEPTYRRLFKVFWKSLVSKGFLFLGHTEIFTKVDGFELIKPAVYRKVGVNE